jgi:hypothetical protein
MTNKDLSKTNIYMAHAKDIQHIAKTNNVDVGVALEMFRSKNGYAISDGLNAQKKEFLAVCNRESLDKVVESLE